MTPSGRGLTRPALPVTLLDGQGDHLAVAHARVDSGADFTTLSGEWANLLGIDLERDCERKKVSVADERPSIRYVYLDGLEIEVLGERMFLPVVMFCQGLPIALLGRRDFFRRYLVLIDQRHSRFFLERLPNLDEDDDDELDEALVAS